LAWARHEGIRQRQLALLLHIDESLITRWKRGDRLPGPRTLPRILQLLHEEVQDGKENGKARLGSAGTRTGPGNGFAKV